MQQIDMGDSATHGYALMTARMDAVKLREVCRFRERWRYIAVPESLKKIIQTHGNARDSEIVYEFGELETALMSVNPSKSRDGFGLGTNYAAWLQEALREGSWLKSSAIMSQFKAKRAMRDDDVECPALVPPLDPALVDENSFSLLWAKRWKSSAEHIGMKEARRCAQ